MYNCQGLLARISCWVIATDGLGSKLSLTTLEIGGRAGTSAAAELSSRARL